MSDLLLGLGSWALVESRRDVLLYLLSLSSLLVGTALCVAALRHAVLDVVAVAVACGGAAAWLLSNGPGEGRTVVEVLPDNGLTVADLVALPAAALVVLLCWRRLRPAGQDAQGAGPGQPEPTARR